MRRRTLLKGLAGAAVTLPSRHAEGTAYTANPDAWQRFREGLRLYRTFLPAENIQARGEFEHAIQLDAGFARAYAMLSAVHRQDWIMGWIQRYQPSQGQALHHANTAVRLAQREPDPQPSLPLALLQRGFVHVYAGRLEEATQDAEAAIAHRPDFADGYALAAHVLCYQVRPLDALNKLNLTASRDPKYPFHYYYYAGHAYYLLGHLTPATDEARRTAHFRQAEHHLRAALSEHDKGPNFRPASSYLVATLSELGRQREAVEQTRRVPRPDYLREPTTLAAYITRTLPYTEPAIRAHLIGLWQAADRGVESVVA